jgi:hypothetical protein
MTRSRDTADTQDNLGGAVAPFVAGKNKIINGDFYWNQRNFTSTTSVAAFGFDRFNLLYQNGTVTYSAQAFSPGTAPVAGYEAVNYARLVTASQSTSSSYATINQVLEGVRTFAGQTVTFSLWAKVSTGTTPIGVAFDQYFGTSGSSQVTITTSTQTITSSWARYSFTLAIPSISGKTIGTVGTDYLRAWLFTSCGTGISSLGYPTVGVQNVQVDTWGWQIENGPVATPFQTASGSIGGELALCQRWYFRTTGGAGYQPVCNGFATSSTNVMGYVQYPVQMRTSPNAIEYATLQCNDSTTGTAVSAVAFSGTEYGPSSATLNFTTGSMTTFRPTKVLQSNSAAGYLALSAEL